MCKKKKLLKKQELYYLMKILNSANYMMILLSLSHIQMEILLGL